MALPQLHTWVLLTPALPLCSVPCSLQDTATRRTAYGHQLTPQTRALPCPIAPASSSLCPTFSSRPLLNIPQVEITDSNHMAELPLAPSGFLRSLQTPPALRCHAHAHACAHAHAHAMLQAGVSQHCPSGEMRLRRLFSATYVVGAESTYVSYTHIDVCAYIYTQTYMRETIIDTDLHI